MSLVETLPLLDGAKVIVIDEGLDVTHATALIAGWVNVWKEKNSDYNIDLLSFSDPKAWYDNEPKPLTSPNIKVPAIETFGTTYVKLERFTGVNPTNNLIYNAKLTHRKSGGSMICQTEIIRQDIESYRINAEKVVVPSIRKTEPEPVKIEASFKIEMSAQEMDQRDKTPLPYTLNATNTSRIFYQPEDVDDIDEEDPDDDLCI
ncbi:uncharacterized protein Elp5 isoform X2 [Temnothorax nylanderi]|uniref:uncharacterized protein Elp5 isoform X2 n=1 Tax=Temnothorax nylanderi TaxID=102681 RepID=UPI003A840EBD